MIITKDEFLPLADEAKEGIEKMFPDSFEAYWRYQELLKAIDDFKNGIYRRPDFSRFAGMGYDDRIYYENSELCRKLYDLGFFLEKR